jgi:hypothetical protein
MSDHYFQFPYDLEIQSSLSAGAQTKLNNFTSAALTPTAPKSRIELYEILLASLSNIQSILAENLRDARRHETQRLEPTYSAALPVFS